jgi:hypothetical protein
VLARQSPENRSNSTVIRCSFHAPQRRNSSISTAMTMSLADYLLQKQQKRAGARPLWQSRMHIGNVEMDRGFHGGLVNR